MFHEAAEAEGTDERKNTDGVREVALSRTSRRTAQRKLIGVRQPARRLQPPDGSDSERDSDDGQVVREPPLISGEEGPDPQSCIHPYQLPQCRIQPQDARLPDHLPIPQQPPNRLPSNAPSISNL